MGDLNAADWCAEAHTRLLREFGSFPEAHTLQNGRPAPRCGAVEALVLDDHLGVAVDIEEDCEAGGPGLNEMRLVESFARWPRVRGFGLERGAGKSATWRRGRSLLGGRGVARLHAAGV